MKWGLTRDEETNVRRVTHQGLNHAGNAVREMLGVVEPDDHLQGRTCRDEPFQRVAAVGLQSQSRSDGAGQRCGVVYGRKLDPSDAVCERVFPVLEQALRKPRLADPTWARDGDQAVLSQCCAELCQFGISADE